MSTIKLSSQNKEMIEIIFWEKPLKAKCIQFLRIDLISGRSSKSKCYNHWSFLPETFMLGREEFHD